MPEETPAEARKRAVRTVIGRHLPWLFLPDWTSQLWDDIEKIYGAESPKRPATPELDRLIETLDSEGHAALEKFLGWLAGPESGNLALARWTVADDSSDEEVTPVPENEFERVLAMFYGFNLDKIENERKAMTDFLRRTGGNP